MRALPVQSFYDYIMVTIRMSGAQESFVWGLSLDHKQIISMSMMENPFPVGLVNDDSWYCGNHLCGVWA